MRVTKHFPQFMILAAAVALVGCATKPAATGKDAAPSTVQAEASGLSPTGDEHFKTINFAISIGNPEAVKGWTFKIGDQKTVVKTVSGNASNLPDSMTWDGKNDSGAMAPEGTYTAMLAIDYGDSFSAGEASSKPFILDITPPSGSFSPNPALFPYSPEGIKAPVSVTVSVKAALAKVASWNIDIFDADGKQLKSLSAAWPKTQAGWDGKTDAGAQITMGVNYPAVLTVKDEFGNAGTFKGSFAISNMPAAQPSSISTRRNGFSPTSVSVKNTLDIVTAIGSKDAVTDWKVVIASATKGTIKTFSGNGGNVPDYERWDGTDDSGKPAAEGAYYATLSVTYGKAFMPAQLKSNTFSLVTTPPSGSVTVDPPTASLSTLGPKSPVQFTVQAKSAFAQVMSWTMSVLDPSGTSVAIFQANWPNNKVAWDGKTVEGSGLIPGATYTVSAKVQDEYGNVGTLTGSLVAEGLPAATEPTSLTAATGGFAPNGNKADATMDFSLSVGNMDKVSGWKLDLVSADSVVVKSFTGTGKQVPATISWNGTGTDGKLAPEGMYSGVLTVNYGLTYAPARAESKTFLLDITPPTGTITLSTKLFSPDGDGENDSETITLTGSSKLASIAGWSMDILDPNNDPFVSFKDDWPAKAVVWDGKGSNGDLVESASDYTVVARIRDQFGNVGEARATIPTDILVIKVGDGYRIRVSSIVFKPFTADFKDVPQDRASRNLNTLDLLASKLSRFPDYKIRLEGHAVMIHWDDKALGAAEQTAVLIPLSKERAEAIKAALVERGIAADRLVTDGVGAQDPIVPDSDFANRWKNRRVEFYIVK